MAATRGGTRKAGQGSKWIRVERRRGIYQRDNHTCLYCGRDVADGALLTLDHIIPVELGGSNANDNLVTACLSCNSAKQDLTLREWAAYLRDKGVDTTGLAKRVRNALRRQVKLVRN